MAAVFWEHQAKTLKMVFSSAPHKKTFWGAIIWGGSNFFRGEHQEAESRLRFYRRVGHLGSRQGDRYGLRD